MIDENEYDVKYDIPHAHMFVIEGMEKVRDVIEKNRKRKLTKHKKLSNNTIIEIDNCSPLEILKLQKNLLHIVEQEHVTFVYGKGKRKPEIQQLYEDLETCGERLMSYKECFEIMGKNRNSYSKTDLEATFMRMKPVDKARRIRYNSYGILIYSTYLIIPWIADSSESVFCF